MGFNGIATAIQATSGTLTPVHDMHRRIVSVAFDRDGAHYGRGAGLKVWVDGQLAASRATLGPLVLMLAD